MSLRAHVDVHSRRKRSRLLLLFALTTLGMVGRPSMSDAAQLTLTWVDNSGGQSAFSIERKTGTAGTYAEIGQQSAGVISYVDTAVSAGTTYCYRVRAFDSTAASAYTNEACGSPAGSFTVTVAKAGSGTGTVASTPIGITCGADCSEPYASGTLVTLSATPSTGSTFSGWSGGGCSGTAPCSLAGNSAVTITATFATAPTDTTTPSVPTVAPSIPANLTAVALSTTQINLNWIASTDPIGVTGYRVERCQGAGCSSFVQVAAPTGIRLRSRWLTPGTTYSYRVRAVDAAGNLSLYSNVATATTPGSGDTTPPSIPTALAASVIGSTQIDLSWPASTDNVGVTGYRVERCQGAGCSSSFVQIAAPTATSFSDGGLTAGTSYSYRVRARDGGGNLSGYSSVVTATTLANTSATTSGQYTIWSSASVPGIAAVPDTNAVEIGVKFRSDSNGVITGIRFYKSTANTGTHVGNLWTSSGQLLASVSFANETASGWQQANFSTPVPISANTTYIASYHTNVGRYAGDNGYFTSRSIDVAPLHAPSSSTVGGNGVYRYSSTSAFPSQTYDGSNYWVDVVFRER